MTKIHPLKKESKMAQIYNYKPLELCGYKNIGGLVQSVVKLSEDPIACRVIINWNMWRIRTSLVSRPRNSCNNNVKNPSNDLIEWESAPSQSVRSSDMVNSNAMNTWYNKTTISLIHDSFILFSWPRSNYKNNILNGLFCSFCRPPFLCSRSSPPCDSLP